MRRGARGAGAGRGGAGQSGRLAGNQELAQAVRQTSARTASGRRRPNHSRAGAVASPVEEPGPSSASPGTAAHPGAVPPRPHRSRGRGPCDGRRPFPVLVPARPGPHPLAPTTGTLTAEVPQVKPRDFGAAPRTTLWLTHSHPLDRYGRGARTGPWARGDACPTSPTHPPAARAPGLTLRVPRAAAAPLEGNVPRHVSWGGAVLQAPTQ